jgi:MFS family permease
VISRKNTNRLISGRKKALIIADCIFLLGSLIQTLCAINTTSLTQLYIGRVIGGFGVGLISAVVPTYIGENANKEIRGRCIGWWVPQTPAFYVQSLKPYSMQLFNVTGICLSFFVNYGISIDIKSLSSAKWRIPFALQMLPGFLLLAGIFFQNESPRWLVEKNRLTDAAKALATVRSKAVDHPDVIQELDEIVMDFQGHEKLPLRAQLKAACSSKRMFYQSSFAVILMFWQQWTGTNSINYYAPQIFKSVGLEGTSAGLFATGVYGIVKIVVTALGLMLATEQIGRKVCCQRSFVGANHILTQMLVESLDRFCGTSLRHVLYRREPSGQPCQEWRRAHRIEHLRHRLRLLVCCVLLFRYVPFAPACNDQMLIIYRMGTHTFCVGERVRPEPCSLSSHGGRTNDPVALQFREYLSIDKLLPSADC